jgi:predicted GNAT family N-acyltransferase
MHITFKRIDSIAEFVDAVRLRYDTFVREMGMQPGWEPDEDDKVAHHFAAFSNDGIAATGRFREVAPGEFKIERMVTRQDLCGSGIGRKMLSFMLTEIKKSDPSRIWLRSQTQVQGFYQTCGFTVCSEQFELFGVQHVDMQYST